MLLLLRDLGLNGLSRHVCPSIKTYWMTVVCYRNNSKLWGTTNYCGVLLLYCGYVQTVQTECQTMQILIMLLLLRDLALNILSRHVCPSTKTGQYEIWAISWDYGTFRPPKSHSSNAHAQPSSGARCLIFGRTLRLLPYFMCANSKGSGETAPSLVACVISTTISWAGSFCFEH